MIETWYVLEDGSVADPREVAPDDRGRLVHKSGVAVAVGPHGPRSRGVDTAALAKPKAEKKADADDEKDAPQGRDRQMKPGKGAKYETR